MNAEGSGGATIEAKNSDVADIGFLTRSPNRVDILRLLSDGSQTSSDLKRQLDLPRTTLRRNLVELADKNWVKEKPTANQFEITQAGEIILNSYTEMTEQVETAGRIASFYAHLPFSLPVDGEALRRCSFTCSTDARPHAPMTRQIELLELCSTVSGLLPVISPYFLETVAGLDTTFEQCTLLSERATFDALQRTEPETLERFRARPGCTVAVVEKTPQYGLYRTDGDPVMTTYTENNRLHTTVEAPSETSVAEWIAQQYDEYAADVREFDP